MNPPFSRRLATALLLALAGAWLPATAQYVWVDANGVKQYSDRPPPSSVPATRVLKQPGRAQSAAPEPAAGQTTAGPTGTQGTPSLAEREADFRKRRIEQAEKQKKNAEEARAASEKARNCERTRDYHAALESGERIARIGRDGEHRFLSEEERNRELGETQQALKNCR